MELDGAAVEPARADEGQQAVLGQAVPRVDRGRRPPRDQAQPVGGDDDHRAAQERGAFGPEPPQAGGQSQHDEHEAEDEVVRGPRAGAREHDEERHEGGGEPERLGPAASAPQGPQQEHRSESARHEVDRLSWKRKHPRGGR